jgi:hypothetical protein
MRLRIVDNLLSRVNELGIKNDVEFFYYMKSIDPTGYIPKKQITSKIKKLKYSKTRFYHYLGKCINLGLIKEYSHGYRLISFESAFNTLKIPVSKTNRVSIVEKLEDIYLYAFVRGIESNLKRQEAKVKAKSKLSKSIVQEIPVGTTDLEERDNLLATSEYCFSREVDSVVINKDITLSVRGVARTLNMSVGFAHRMLKLVEEFGLLEIIKREKFVSTWVGTFEDFRKEYKSPKFQLKDGAINYIFPSLLIPTIDTTSFTSLISFHI